MVEVLVFGNSKRLATTTQVCYHSMKGDIVQYRTQPTSVWRYELIAYTHFHCFIHCSFRCA